MNYTKGEWISSKLAENDFTIVVPSHKFNKSPTLIARVIKEGDANLIATTLDMYEALKDILQLMGDSWPMSTRIKNILAKAEDKDAQ